jgi:hypothetical protein
MGRVITGIVPPTGWHYDQGIARIEAPTYDALPAAVEHYRVMNDIPLGDVAADIEKQICQKYPRQCRSGEVVSTSFSVKKTSSKTPMSQLIDDAVAWARALSASAIIPVTKDVAEKRAQVCATCPAMIKYSGCPDCVADIERRSAHLRASQDTAHTRKLGGCKAWRVDARSACFLSRELLPQHPINDPPRACWVNPTL